MEPHLPSSNGELQALTDPEVAALYDATELYDILLRCRGNWQSWQQYFFVALYYLWSTDKWTDLPDHNGLLFTRTGDFLSELAREIKLSKNYLQKVLGIMRVYDGQGFDPAEAASLSINTIDAIRGFFESDRQTGEILRLTPAAEKNLPLPDSPPGERIVEAARDMAELSPGEAIRYAQQMAGEAIYLILPALLEQKNGTWKVGYKRVDDAGELHADITVTCYTPAAYAWIQKLLGGAEL